MGPGHAAREVLIRHQWPVHTHCEIDGTCTSCDFHPVTTYPVPVATATPPQVGTMKNAQMSSAHLASPPPPPPPPRHPHRPQVSKVAVFVMSSSYAVLASAIDSLVDLLSQAVLAVAEYQVSRCVSRSSGAAWYGFGGTW